MSCCICEEISKYKCPTCFIPYCSVVCCKKHKESPCVAPAPPPIVSNAQERIVQYEFPTEDTVPQERLKLLEQSDELRKCLENPHVRDILEKLDKCPNPDQLIQKYMQEPIFTEFVDACLNTVQPPAED